MSSLRGHSPRARLGRCMSCMRTSVAGMCVSWFAVVMLTHRSSSRWSVVTAGTLAALSTALTGAHVAATGMRRAALARTW
jgi:hypothetical protein